MTKGGKMYHNIRWETRCTWKASMSLPTEPQRGWKIGVMVHSQLWQKWESMPTSYIYPLLGETSIQCLIQSSYALPKHQHPPYNKSQHCWGMILFHCTCVLHLRFSL